MNLTNTHSRFHSNAHNNGGTGFLAFQLDKEDGEILLEDVTSKNNLNNGMQLSGTGVTVRNAEVSGNDAGIIIVGFLPFPTRPLTGISLEGQISSYNNYGSGVVISNFIGVANGTVDISANLNMYLNGLSGFETSTFPDVISGSSDTLVDVTLESGGSIAACNNGGNTNEADARADPADILNNGNSTFTGLGLGRYTCDSVNGTGVLPECKPCPACYTSLKRPPFVTGRGGQGKGHGKLEMPEMPDNVPTTGPEACGDIDGKDKCIAAAECQWDKKASPKCTSGSQESQALSNIEAADAKAEQPSTGYAKSTVSTRAIVPMLMLWSQLFL